MRFGFVTVLTLLMIGCGKESSQPKPTAVTPGAVVGNDAALLKGKWQVVAIVASGNPVADDKVRTLELVYEFDGTTMTVTRPGRPAKGGKYTQDSSAKPKRLTLDQDGTTVNGSYSIEGSRLTLCLAVDGGSHPAKLESSKSPATDLLTLEKQN